MESEWYWNLFMQTGDIEAYLVYTKEEHTTDEYGDCNRSHCQASEGGGLR